MEKPAKHEELRNIREIRKRKQLTQQEVAKKAKCHQSYYSKVERGEADVTISKLKDIAAAIGANIIIIG